MGYVSNMQLNITNISNDEINYFLGKLGIERINGDLRHKKTNTTVGWIYQIYLEIDFEKLKKLEIVKI